MTKYRQPAHINSRAFPVKNPKYVMFNLLNDWMIVNLHIEWALNSFRGCFFTSLWFLFETTHFILLRVYLFPPRYHLSVLVYLFIYIVFPSFLLFLVFVTCMIFVWHFVSQQNRTDKERRKNIHESTQQWQKTNDG